MDHYVIHIYGLVIHTWNALTLWAFSVFSCIKRCVKSFVGFFQCIAKITNLSYSYHTTITADHTWNEKLKLATYDQVEWKILWKSSTKRQRESNMYQYNYYNMIIKNVFLPEVLKTVISLLTSSSVTLPLLMARRVSSRSAPVGINNDQNWHYTFQSSLTKFDISLITINKKMKNHSSQKF